MEAQSLTISVPPPFEYGLEEFMSTRYIGKEMQACDKNCPYCISAMTGYVKPDLSTVFRNLGKAHTLARAANVSNVMLTGKGEPMLNFETTCYIMRRFEEYPIEIQTNGLWLSKHLDNIGVLHQAGLDVLAISVDHLNQMDEMKDLIKATVDRNMTCRICLNLTDKIPTDLSFSSIFGTIASYGVHQLLIRNVMVPQVCVDTPRSNAAVKWIGKHVDPKIYKKLYVDFEAMVNREKDLVRILPHGAEVFTIDGMDVSFSDYCVQESNNTKDIRSLIFLEDGHMYTSWDKIPSSRLF